MNTTKPSDAAIAMAFYAISHEDGYYRTSILKRAKEIDALTFAGTIERPLTKSAVTSC